MEAQSWGDLQRHFNAALKRASGERAAFVEGLELSPEMRAQLEELLGAHEAGERLLEPVEPAPTPVPETIGPFRIVRELGRGGMGIVYEAEQAQPKRTVALKMLRAEAATPSLLRRFERESQVLARLQHPGIAQVYEAGSQRVGDALRPYFAMELVRGEPLTRYAERHGLSLRDRLELLARVADAVQHAHLSGVIHRDLKPSNILVGADGAPKVLDFGVARVTESDTLLSTQHTALGQLVGTLAYMSPEQTRGAPDELDTRSDVYSLGVVAFEVLTGRLPHDVTRAAPLEALRRIQEDDATRVSSFDARLRGDIDTIVAKALEKDRERRYATAHEFAEDLRRYLRDEPIQARPASRGYQLRKFARRNRALAAAIVALFVVLAVAAGVSTRLALLRQRALDASSLALELAEQRGTELEAAGRELEAALARATEARDEADRERAVAQAVRDFLTDDVLAQGDPTVNFDRELSVADALEQAGANVSARFAASPQVELALQRMLATSLQHLRRHEQAAEHAQRVVELTASLYGEGSSQNRGARRDLAVIELDAGRMHEAQAALEQLYASIDAALAPADSERLRTMANLASALYVTGDNARARALLEEAVALAGEGAALDDGELWRWRKKLAEVRQAMSDYPGALALLDALVSEQSAALGDDHPFVLDARNSAALVHMERLELARAEEISRDVVARSERVLGPEHLNTLSARTVLANILQRMGRFDEALELHIKTLAAQRARGEAALSDALATQYSMAAIHQATGRLAEAEQLAVQTFEAQLERFGEAHYFTVLSLNLLGMVHNEQGRLETAAEDFQRVIELASRVHGPRSANVASGVNNLASVYERLQRYDEALELYEQVIELHTELYGPEGPNTLISRSNLGGLHLGLRRLDEAEKELRAAADGLSRALGPEHWLVGVTLQKLGMAVQLLGRPQEALELLERAATNLERALGASNSRAVSARQLLERVRELAGSQTDG